MRTDSVAETGGTTLRWPTWSAARWYLVISGVFLLVVGAVGFLYERSFPIGADAARAQESAFIFGILETNGWHNLAAVVGGLVALGFALRPGWARTGALLKGGFYVLLTVLIEVRGPEALWIASNFADQVVHATLGVTGLGTGLLTRPARRAPA